ncbi:MAG TPA: Ig-like domain-containing protein [Solirubrobacteraceae bacterium]
MSPRSPHPRAVDARFAPPRKNNQSGFTIVETMVAASVLLVGVLALLSVLDMANAVTTKHRSRDVATNLARQLTEAARSIPYSALTPETVESELQEQPGLASTSAGPWRIDRHRIRFAVSATVCAVDDPSDGTGPHDSGLYCADSGGTGNSDKNPDDYKRVTVDLTWTVKNREHKVHQVAVVNHPGSAGGPSVKALTIAPPGSAKVLTELAALGFTATTTGAATTLAFSVDGVTEATATGTGTAWTFSWPIAELSDGTHLVTAQAFDQQGLSGATRSVTVTLNRFVPFAPSGLAGGRNGSVVELEWLPNSERDIVGYRAFRASLTGNVLVCPLTRETSCEDPAPPPGPLTYFVVATDLSPAGEYRDGLPSTSIDVLSASLPPHPPQNVQAVESADGVTLSWGAPLPADEDHGAVAFYRIYRDGTSRADRYDRTGTASELSLVDGRTDGTPHQYWVTAVDSNLAESAPVGPVTA